MSLLDDIAEARIQEARERGEFDHLPGAGRPLELEEDALVPEELRVAYRILKNAGCLPREVELRREVHELGQLLGALEDPGERDRAARRLRALQLRLELSRGPGAGLDLEHHYAQRVYERLAATERDPDAG